MFYLIDRIIRYLNNDEFMSLMYLAEEWVKMSVFCGGGRKGGKKWNGVA